MASKRSSLELVKTGINGLDTIFLGGIRSGNVVLVEGAPGTGKTTLGMEFIYRGAKEFKENGIIISFESSPERLLRDAKNYGWDFEALKKKKQMVKIIHMNPAMLFQDLLSPESRIIEEIKTIHAKRIFIDGITPLKLYSGISDPATFRNSFFALIEGLQKLGMTAVFSREIADNTIQSMGPDEQYICDTIITLSKLIDRSSCHRRIEINKSRGQDYISGIHTVHFITGQGMQVYRRTESQRREYIEYPSSSKKISTGIVTLDPVIGGGVYEGSVTLVVGISGTGKTVMGLQFLNEGVNQGEKTLFISLDEPQNQILRNAKTLKLGIDTQIKDEEIILFCESPLDLEMDVHLEKIIQIIEEQNIKRVVLDSVIGYKNANNLDAQQFIYTLASYLKSKLITSFFNYESPELLGLSQISEELKASAIVDNIILLNYVEISTQMRRAVTVPKARGSAIPQRTREFTIDENGVRLLDEDQRPDVEDVPQLPFSSYYGVLSRAPARHSPAIESKIAKGEDMPETSPLS